MMTREQLYPLARRIFWGYFFILLNFNLTFNNFFALQLIPTSVGWWLLARVCGTGRELRPSLGLLRPLCLGLAGWNLLQFFPALDPYIPAVFSLLAGVISLYAHFQLLTDLAALAQLALPNSEQVRQLRTARTALVVIQTLSYCYDLLFRLPSLVLIVAAACLVVYIYILVRLWGLQKSLKTAPF